MCKCTPEIRTPFCGKPGCEGPKGQASSAKLCYPQRFEQLMRFYSVTTMEDLVDAQYNHIERLQDSKPLVEPKEPRNYRRG